MVRGISCSSLRHRFQKAPFSKCFPSSRKRKASVFKILRFEERFWKAPLLRRIGAGGKPNRRNKAALQSNFSNLLQRSLCGRAPAWVNKNREVLCQVKGLHDEWKTHLPKMSTLTSIAACTAFKWRCNESIDKMLLS